jgi:hypothetical protein
LSIHIHTLRRGLLHHVFKKIRQWKIIVKEVVVRNPSNITVRYYVCLN